MPGPIPKRSSERVRRNKTNDAGLELKRGTARGVSEWGKPSESWHPAVVRMYESFKSSGMADFFENTDVQMVYMACEGMQAWYDGGCRSANQFSFATNLLASLGATEGERRRMRIELDVSAEEVTEEQAAYANVVDFKARNLAAG